MSLLKNILLLLPCTVIGCNTQIAVTGEARERLLYPIPYGARWVKEGMTRESRLADWVACGGGSDLRDGFRTNRYQEPMRQYLSDLELHRYNLWSCMTSKNYLYFNKDYEYEYPKVTGTSQKCDSRCLYP
jgi:hypothetical protein